MENEFDLGLGRDDDDDVDNDDHSPTLGVGVNGFFLDYYNNRGGVDREVDLEPCEGTRVSSSRRSRKDGAIIQRSFVCAKEGFRNLNEKRTKDREIKRPRTVTRVGCKASMSVKDTAAFGKWIVRLFVKGGHNHELVPADQVHCLRSHRQISGPAKTLIDTLQAAGMGPRRIMSALIKEYGGISKVGFTEVDCRNYMRNNRQRSLEGDVQILHDYLRQMHADNLSSFFYVSGRSVRGEGSGHGSQQSMQIPVSITTDHDSVIQSAVMQVFPDTRHRFCKWHIFNKCQDQLSHVFLQYPNFESDLHKCVNLTDSIDEFEACWLSLVDKYQLSDHEWLQEIYSSRRQWVPVYLRDTFFAEMSITQRSDSMNSYFDGYVNASTTLNQFVKMYEKALESRNEKEVKADYDTMNTLPLLRTPSPMEKQASQLYTRKIFMRFQEELVETLTLMASKTEAEDDDGDVTTTTYQVAKFGEENKSYHVNFNVLEMKASCSCCMFEFSGLLCRHVLAVFRVTNVLTLPSSYILKRWTINAKSSVILEEHALFSSYLESHTVRYNTLKHEAFKFVEEGAESVDTYNVAMIALEEAARRVSIAAKNEGTINGRNSREGLRSNGTLTKRNTGNHHGDFDHNLSEDEMDRKIQELNSELDCVRRKCEVYRANLLSVLKDIEDHKQQLALKHWAPVAGCFLASNYWMLDLYMYSSVVPMDFPFRDSINSSRFGSSGFQSHLHGSAYCYYLTKELPSGNGIGFLPAVKEDASGIK
ncbi:protein FAR1-related sequence 5 [Tanacetum coccineum]